MFSLIPLPLYPHLSLIHLHFNQYIQAHVKKHAVVPVLICVSSPVPYAEVEGPKTLSSRHQSIPSYDHYYKGRRMGVKAIRIECVCVCAVSNVFGCMCCIYMICIYMICKYPYMHCVCKSFREFSILEESIHNWMRRKKTHGTCQGFAFTPW